MECEVKDCNNEAYWFLYRINENRSKDWIKVCDKHEELISDNNLYLQGYSPRTGLLLEVKK